MDNGTDGGVRVPKPYKFEDVDDGTPNAVKHREPKGLSTNEARTQDGRQVAQRGRKSPENGRTVAFPRSAPGTPRAQ